MFKLEFLFYIQYIFFSYVLNILYTKNVFYLNFNFVCVYVFLFVACSGRQDGLPSMWKLYGEKKKSNLQSIFFVKASGEGRGSYSHSEKSKPLHALHWRSEVRAFLLFLQEKVGIFLHLDLNQAVLLPSLHRTHFSCRFRQLQIPVAAARALLLVGRLPSCQNAVEHALQTITKPSALSASCLTSAPQFLLFAVSLSFACFCLSYSFSSQYIQAMD